MFKKKQNSIDMGTKKLLFFNTLIFMLITFILYLIIPSVLNYPPNTTDNNFQVDMVGITYTNQFILLGIILTFLFYITMSIVFRRISNADITDEKQLSKFRKMCFNYPYLLLLIEPFLPTLISGILLKIFNTDFDLLVRLCIIIFSFASLLATLSYIFNRNFFIKKLIETSSKQNAAIGIKLNMWNKLVIQILPLFLCSFVTLILFMTSMITSEKGDLLYHFYRQELLSNFNSKTVYSTEDVLSTLKNLELNNDSDSVFMFSADTLEVFYEEDTINDFLKNYTANFYETTQGHSYEYYGQSISSSVLKVQTDKGDFFIGIRFITTSNDLIGSFIFLASILLILDILFIIYIGKNLSSDLKTITSGLDLISHSENIVNADNLPITSTDEIGDLTQSFNNVKSITTLYLEQIHNSQETLMEKERLASLGQLIGGIAHNLKTPIMSISGAAEGLNDLIKEYDASIEDPEVNAKDHHEIAHDMTQWIKKIKTHTEYMSDVITAVKGQAVNFANEDAVSFTVGELLKRINILMKHELKNAITYLNVQLKTDENLNINGDVNSLVQVVNNMISNSIQAYNGKTDQNIDLIVEKKDSNLYLSIKDYASGLPESVKHKLFKEMVTTKGKNGTGLGLYMSYSTIKAHFKGNITVESEKGKGTTFTITIPIKVN